MSRRRANITWARKPHRMITDKQRDRAAYFLNTGRSIQWVANHLNLTVYQVAGLKGGMITGGHYTGN